MMVKSKLISIFLSVLSLFLFTSVALSQDIDIEPDPVCGGKGERVIFTVVINNAPNEVEAFGFDVVGCTDILKYVSYTRGNLTKDWDFFDCNPLEPGRVRVGGFTTKDKIEKGAGGSVVNLQFEVVGENDCYLNIEDMVDDIIGWRPESAEFTYIYCAEGAGIKVKDVSVPAEGEVAIPILLDNAPNRVDAFGFDVLFDDRWFTYKGCKPGDLTKDWDFFDCNDIEEDIVRVGGFTTKNKITKGATGEVVILEFEVIECQPGDSTKLIPFNPVDNIGGWSACPGEAYYGCAHDGIAMNDQCSMKSDTITFTVSVNSAPNEVDAFGFDVNFDHSILTYEAYTRGDLVEEWDFFDVSNPVDGVVRVGGFTTKEKIAEDASGAMVKLTFTVISVADDTLTLSELVDDIAGWSTKDGSFTYFAIEPSSVTMCVGAIVEFTIMPEEIGISPFTWFVDGVEVQTGDSRIFEYRGMEARAYIISLEDSSVPPLSAQATAALEAEDDTGALDIPGAFGQDGGTVTIPVRIQDAPNEVSSLGVEIHFDPDILQFDSFDFAGTLLEGFDFKDVSNPLPGVLRLGGFTVNNPVAVGSTGDVVYLSFNVACEDCTVSKLELLDLVDNIATWTASGSCFLACFAISIDPTTATVNVSEEQIFNVVGGLEPFTWSIVNGEGTLSSTTGEQVTADAPTGGVTVTIQVGDNLEQTATATVNVYEELAIDPTSATVMVGETQNFQVVGGLKPYNWSIVDDDGIKGSLDPTEGEQVTYTAPPDEVPDGLVTIWVQDSLEQTATVTVTVEPEQELTQRETTRIPNPGDGGGCFVATAAFGSVLEGHVDILGQFRDAYLLSTKVRQTFVATYYMYSPPVADFMAGHEGLRAMVRWSLLPVIGVSWMILHIGPGVTLALMGLLIFVMCAGAGLTLRRMRLRRQA